MSLEQHTAHTDTDTDMDGTDELARLWGVVDGIRQALAAVEWCLSRLGGARRARYLLADPQAGTVPAGAELRALRVVLGLSQQGVAAAAYLSRSEISEIECGRRQNLETRSHLYRTLQDLGAAQMAPAGAEEAA